MNVDFYFDPSCPFCWITSRWLLMVTNKRTINIKWHLFSLAIKNSELDQKDQESTFNHLPAHRVERVMLAAHRQKASLLDMYTAFGIQHFLAGEEYSDQIIVSVLEDLKIDKNLVKFADDSSLDDQLRKSTNQAVEIVGSDIGVPTIVFAGKDNKKTGFFGPVLQELPEIDESVELWDGLVKLANNPNFYELKRGRPQTGPDVVSTAKC